jgi:glycerol-3-phosphate O-acyltransferase/dihydroxyacetone phosphate acyltransferase
MLYQILRLIIFIAVKIFFRSAHIRDVDNVPKKGGLLLAANHPATFLDPFVLAVWLNRPIYFLTNGGMFKNPILAWLFKQFFMVPIYRKQDGNDIDKASKNEQAFEACYKLLAKGGVIVIFPEGVSEDERRLRKLKTGLARIALGAEASHDFDLGVQIVCAGINYTNPRQFQSEVFVQYDSPIAVSNYKENYLKDATNAIQMLTTEVEKRLSSLIVVTTDDETDNFVRKLETLYSHNLQEFLELPSHNTEQIFVMAQHFADASNYFRLHETERYTTFKNEVTHYFDLLAKHQIKDKEVASYSTSPHTVLTNLPWLLLAFPIYLLGLLHNFIPYQLPAWVALRLTKEPVFLASINFSLGIVFFSIFYAFYGFAFYAIFHSHFLAFLYCCLIAVAGFSSYYYWHFAKKIFRIWKLGNIIQKDDTLLVLRKNIMINLEKSRDDYMLIFYGNKKEE